MKISYQTHRAYTGAGERSRLEGKDIPYIVFPILEQTGTVVHGFSTRIGGVSKAPYDELNLSFTRGDEQEAVAENFRRIGARIGVKPEQMVLSAQTHTSNIRIVGKEDCGNGITRRQQFQDVDALVTNTPGVCLVTSYADCVPLYFLDPVKRVIAASHAGWRGTVARIGPKTVELMREQFGCAASDIRAVIGPSICQDCYQVSEDVACHVADALEKSIGKLPRSVLRREERETGGAAYRLNLWEVNRELLFGAGLRKEHIAVSGICTRCNNSLFFSHRATGEKRGNLCAFLMLKQ